MADQNGRRGQSPRKDQPLKGAPPDRLLLLGRLLAERRGELGFPVRADFARQAGPEWSLVSDLENGRRDTFPSARLATLAAAYKVTTASMIDVAWGRADALEPAGPVTVARLPDGTAPETDPVLSRVPEAAWPYAIRVIGLYKAAADRTGLGDPHGSEVFGSSDTWAAEAWERLRRRNPSVIDRLVIISSATIPEGEANPGREHGSAAGLAAASGSSAGGAA